MGNENGGLVKQGSGHWRGVQAQTIKGKRINGKNMKPKKKISGIWKENLSEPSIHSCSMQVMMQEMV